MAIQQTYFGTREISKSALVGGGTINRGLRVVINAADGSVSLAGNSVRGDFITTETLTDNSLYLTAAGLNQPGTCAAIQAGCIIVVQSGTVGTVGATCYVDNTGTTGEVSNLNTSGIIMGKYMNACAVGDLVSVLIENPL